MLSKLRKPTKTNLSFLQDWFRRPEMGNLPISSMDRDAWCKEEEGDLMVVDDQAPRDLFTAWTNDTLIPAFHLAIGRHFKDTISWDPTSGLSSYSDRRVQHFVDALGTLVSSLFPVLSIVVLYCVNRTALRLGIIAIFTGIFSLALSLLTQARRVEIFAATTA